MEGPNWYREWRHEAVHQLQEKTARLQANFRLGAWPRYDYDLDTGLLTFSEAGLPRVTAEIEVVGTTSTKAANWLWAWANAHWPRECVKASQLVRIFGEEHSIGELASEYVTDVDDLNALGWELSAVTARVTQALAPIGRRPPTVEPHSCSSRA